MGKTKLTAIGEENKKPQEAKKKPERVHLSGLKGRQRVKVVEADLAQTEQGEISTSVETSTKQRKQHTRGKKYLMARAKVDPKKAYSPAEAAKLLKETSFTKFDGSIELHLTLNKESANTHIELPHSTGKTKKIEIANDETIEKLKTGKIDFDILLSSPEMMPKLVPFAKLLGPKGLMPNPKNGTLVQNPRESATKISANQITVKTEKSAPLTHNIVAKVSQPEREIEENIKAVIDNIGEKNIKKAVASASMGPGIQIAI